MRAAANQAMARDLSSAAERRWAADEEDLKAQHPDLRLVRRRVGRARIGGSIEVREPSGRWQRFEVSIRYRGLNPFDLPDTFDPAKRFDPTGDNHVEPSGRFCMWLPQTAPVADFCRPGGLLRYLERVREFILLQLAYETRKRLDITPHWCGNEWDHGDGGHRQWLSETTTSLTPDQFEALLDSVATCTSAGYRCPCRSGKRLGNCHKRWIRNLRRTTRDDPAVLSVAREFLREWREALGERSARHKVRTDVTGGRSACRGPH